MTIMLTDHGCNHRGACVAMFSFLRAVNARANRRPYDLGPPPERDDPPPTPDTPHSGRHTWRACARYCRRHPWQPSTAAEAVELTARLAWDARNDQIALGTRREATQ